MALYVNFEKPRTIKEFLIKFYTSKNFNYSDATLTASNTYKDVECKILHCDKTVRSFDDLLEIIQTYYPSTTLKILVFHLLTVKHFNKKGKKMYPYLGVCNGMGRIRYLPYHDITSLTDEYFNKKMTYSKYTWGELLILLNIKTKKEFLEFVKNN